MKKILWWNLGHIFFWNPRNWIKFFKKQPMDCYFRPKNGKKISDWVKKEDFDVVMFGEIEKVSDIYSFDLPDHIYFDWVQSESHFHGRCILSKMPFTKECVKIQGINIVSYEFNDCVLLPVHLHFSDTKVRCTQVSAYLAYIVDSQKKCIMVGDFNMWCIVGLFQLWKGDQLAYSFLKETLFEVSRKIKTTEILPWFKLDYIFCSKKIKDFVTCMVAKNHPKIRTDHSPLEFIVSI